MDIRIEDDQIDALEVYYKISAAIKKAITLTKAGETGFKGNASGQYFNALESINDTFKFIEDAINSVGINTAERKYLQIGINANSASVYIEDQNKYDCEGPKNLYDQTMLADYFVKLVNDHPLLTYIEDPFADGDILGHQKILKRMKDKGVKVGIKNWFGSDLDKIQEFT